MTMTNGNVVFCPFLNETYVSKKADHSDLQHRASESRDRADFKKRKKLDKCFLVTVYFCYSKRTLHLIKLSYETFNRG